MKHLDFLSSSPSIYLLKEKRGKNKLGGFFSIIFSLAMIALAIYYLYNYFLGLEYNLIFYRDIWPTSMDDKQKESINKPKSFFLGIVSNPNNAKIKPFLIDYDDNFTPAEKCENNPNETIFTDMPYCFDLSFFELNIESKKGNYSLILFCEENCTKPNGESAEINVIIMAWNLKIDHSKENPLIEKDIFGYNFQLTLHNDMLIQDELIFSPILYNSSQILNTKTKSYINSFLTDTEPVTIDMENNGIFGYFYTGLKIDCDIYIREYITLLDILSKIGGLFSPFKLLFEFLIMFYSDFEINSEVTKNVFSKINNYEFKPVNIENKQNNVKFKELNKDIKFSKKFNVNKGEQFFCGFYNSCCGCCNFCRTHRTMKILNYCSDFVKTYLSAENIIFNMILFESYYKNNPIKYNIINPYLKQIDMGIEDDIIEDENNEEVKNAIKDENDKKEELIALNPIE